MMKLTINQHEIAILRLIVRHLHIQCREVSRNLTTVTYNLDTRRHLQLEYQVQRRLRTALYANPTRFEPPPA